MNKLRIKIFFLLIINILTLSAQSDLQLINYKYLSTLFDKYEFNNSWAGLNSLIKDKSKLESSYENIIYNKSDIGKNIILDDSLRFSILLYTGGETGDPLYHKYSRPNENLPNKNKIIPSLDISISKKWNSFSIISNLDFNGYFITGSNKNDKQVFKLDPVLMDKNNYNFNFDGIIKIQNVFIDWEIKKLKGWGFLPFEENITYHKNEISNLGLEFNTKLFENKIEFQTNLYEIVKPKYQLFKTQNILFLGKLNFFKNNREEHSLNYSFGKIMSDNENKKNLYNGFYFSADYRVHLDLGKNIQLKSSLGYKKNKIENKGIKFYLSFNKIDSKSIYKIGFNYEPLDYNYEKYLYDYKWEFEDLLFVNEYIKPSLRNCIRQIDLSYLFDDNNLKINFTGNLSSLNNYYSKKYRKEGNTLIRYFEDNENKIFGELSCDIEYQLAYFKIRSGIKQSFSKLNEIPKTIFFTRLGYTNNLGMKIELEYDHHSETKWDEVYSKYSSNYDCELSEINIFNLLFKQNLENINIKEIDVGLMIYNLFDKRNQYVPLAASIGRTIVFFIKSDFKLNL